MKTQKSKDRNNSDETTKKIIFSLSKGSNDLMEKTAQYTTKKLLGESSRPVLKTMVKTPFFAINSGLNAYERSLKGQEGSELIIGTMLDTISPIKPISDVIGTVTDHLEENFISEKMINPFLQQEHKIKDNQRLTIQETGALLSKMDPIAYGTACAIGSDPLAIGSGIKILNKLSKSYEESHEKVVKFLSASISGDKETLDKKTMSFSISVPQMKNQSFSNSLNKYTENGNKLSNLKSFNQKSISISCTENFFNTSPNERYRYFTREVKNTVNEEIEYEHQLTMYQLYGK